MEICTQSTSLYMFISFSILLLFLTEETTLGLTEEDTKNEVNKSKVLLTLLLMNFLLTIYFLFVIKYDQVEMPVSSRDFSPQVPKTSLTPFVVELSIICDKDFGDIFHHNIVNISNYWKTYIWDVNNRFKTLTKTNITFHIASIRVIRVINWAPIENAKESGKVKLAKFLPEFAKWTYTRWNASRPLRYDVVIGVTGLSFTGIESGYSYRNGSCNFNHRDSKIYSTAVFTDRGDFRVGTLSHELAHILGAKHDYDCEEKPRHYIMDYSNWRGVSLQFKFSQCSDEDISNFLKYPTTSYCLKVQNSNHIEYRANDDPEVVPPNMNEQCKRLFGNETAILVTSEYSEKICQRMECGLKGATGEVEFIRTYTPVDNSRCGKTGVI